MTECGPFYTVGYVRLDGASYLYSGSNRKQALSAVVSLLASGKTVLAGRRFNTADAYISVTDGHGDLRHPAADAENALLEEARTLATEAHECDRCLVQPDGTHDDGTACPCSTRNPIDGCRCQPSPAQWYGPGYIRAELAAQEN